jgi:hypothetical protein
MLAVSLASLAVTMMLSTAAVSAAPLGSVTEFSTGLNSGATPAGIALGANGNMWFTDDGVTPAIGEITPSGTITEFSTGLNSGASPRAIATGPEGYVWFTDKGATRAIGRVAPNGAITEFSYDLPGGSEPLKIAAGPEGDMWFTDNGATPAIGRMGTGLSFPEGKEGQKGAEGPEGPEGPKGTNGENGANGINGKEGSPGKEGPAGKAGAQGPAGPTGAQGPAGKVEIVMCKKVKRKQHCTTKLVSGIVTFTTTGSAAQATLSRRGVVYAAGTARTARGRMSLRLTPLRSLRPGRYTLTLISGAGKHERITTESFVLS